MEKYDIDATQKIRDLLAARTPYILKHSRIYGKDDIYLTSPVIAFNYATNVSTSTFASISERYLSDSAIKSDDLLFATKVVDKFFDDFPQPKLSFEDFVAYADSKIQKKIKQMLREKEHKSMNDLSDDEFGNICSWFVKEQFKFNAKPNIKGAQGIIAWSKTKNLLYLFFVKYIEYYFNEIKKYVINPAKYKPEEFVLKIQSDFKSTNPTVCSDMSGYDRTQNATTLLIEKLFYERIANKSFGKKYLKYFENRSVYTVIGEFVNQYIRNIKASGEEGTIDMNTLLKLMETNFFFDISWEEDGLVAVQGDDDLVNKPYVINENNMQEFAKYVSLDLKITFDEIPEFAGKIIYPGGFAPDLFRTSLRLFAKMNTSSFVEKLDSPINNRFLTKYERDNYNVDKKDTLRFAVEASLRDIIKNLNTEKIEILNRFYAQHSPIKNLGEISAEFIKFASDNTVDTILSSVL